MAKQKSEHYEVDEIDGFPRQVIGEWSFEDKHERLKRYVFASHGARRRFWREFGRECGFIDLYCGPGKAKIRDSGRVVDGSPITAAKTARECTPFQKYVIGDIDQALLTACSHRLEAVNAQEIVSLKGPAERTVSDAVKELDKRGLHFAFVDPFNANLPFSVIETLSSLDHMDQLLHFSVMDFRRNMKEMMRDGRLDALAPGWASVVSKSMGIDEQRRAIFDHWRGLLCSKLRYKVSDKVVNVPGPNKADIYWLVFVSRHDLGGKLWAEVSDLSPQGRLI
jgi:three-Cys-motif partner protein